MPPSDDDGQHRGEGQGFFLPPPSQPRKAVGGIRARARSERPGETWWARRWFAALDALGMGERLERGRAYARGGQVLTLDQQVGVVHARVQGTRRTPYDTRIELAPLAQLEWLEVARELASRGAYRAALLAGTMPEDIEAVFARCGVTLFPQLEEDLTITCTCDDWALPCKHAAAVCFVLAESFDRDPFTLFLLRGIERDVLLALLDGTEAAGAGIVSDSGERNSAAAVPAAAEADAAAFWKTPADADPIPTGFVDLQAPVLDAPLVRLLGPLPQWRGREEFTAAMTRLHTRIGSDPRALDAAQR
ncbi:MAG: SWIM zinc finger family protein [Gaiellales bacterium]